MSFVSQVEFDLAYDKLVALETSFLEAKADYTESLNTIWMLLAAMLVFFMHAGFSMLEAGCVRIKNTQNILAKNLIVVTTGFLCWWGFGFSLAIAGSGDDGYTNQMAGGGTDCENCFMSGFSADQTNYRLWFFQGAFCATAGTIVSGAMAERTQLKGFATYIVIMTTIIYPIVVWWGWSGKGIFWNDDGAITGGPALIDFAGSSIVHLTGGVGALVGALVVGPRKDRWDPDHENAFAAHNVPLCVLGTFFLWFGWYGFNPGSTLSMSSVSDANKAGLVACNTTLAPCAAGLVVFFLRAKVVAPKALDVGGFCNGILAGLVAITAGCAAVKSSEAIIIGFIAGLVYQGTSMLVRRLKIDDVVDAVAVHGANGIWGVLALGFFGDPEQSVGGGNGLFYSGSFAQLGTQLFAVIMICLWVGGLSAIIFLPLRMLGMLRLGDEFQDKGADLMEHSPGKAYTGADLMEHSPGKVYTDTGAAAAVTHSV